MSTLFTEEELMTTVMAATGKTALEIIRKLENNGNLSHEEATTMRKVTLERFGNDVEKAKKIHKEHGFDPFKEFKYPW